MQKEILEKSGRAKSGQMVAIIKDMEKLRQKCGYSGCYQKSKKVK